MPSREGPPKPSRQEVEKAQPPLSAEAIESSLELNPEQILRAPLPIYEAFLDRYFPVFGYPTRELSQEMANAVIERTARELSGGTDIPKPGSRLLRSVRSAEDGAVNNRVHHAFISTIRNHTEYAQGLLFIADDLAGEAHLFDPEVYIEGIAEIIWRPTVPNALKSAVFECLLYQYSFFSEHYEAAVLKNLDFIHPEHYARTAAFLEFIYQFYLYASEIDYAEWSMEESLRRSATMNRTGDALGRILDTVSPEGHHLTASFEEAFSGPEVFAGLAEAFRSYLSQAALRPSQT